LFAVKCKQAAFSKKSYNILTQKADSAKELAFLAFKETSTSWLLMPFAQLLFLKAAQIASSVCTSKLCWPSEY
jgi:hypothetical protein